MRSCLLSLHSQSTDRICSGCSFDNGCLFLLVHINRRGLRTMRQKYDRDMEEKQKKKEGSGGKGPGDAPWLLGMDAPRANAAAWTGAVIRITDDSCCRPNNTVVD